MSLKPFVSKSDLGFFNDAGVQDRAQLLRNRGMPVDVIKSTLRNPSLPFAVHKPGQEFKPGTWAEARALTPKERVYADFKALAEKQGYQVRGGLGFFGTAGSLVSSAKGLAIGKSGTKIEDLDDDILLNQIWSGQGELQKELQPLLQKAVSDNSPEYDNLDHFLATTPMGYEEWAKNHFEKSQLPTKEKALEYGVAGINYVGDTVGGFLSDTGQAIKDTATGGLGSGDYAESIGKGIATGHRDLGLVYRGTAGWIGDKRYEENKYDNFEQYFNDEANKEVLKRKYNRYVNSHAWANQERLYRQDKVKYPGAFEAGSFATADWLIPFSPLAKPMRLGARWGMKGVGGGVGWGLSKMTWGAAWLGEKGAALPRKAAVNTLAKSLGISAADAQKGIALATTAGFAGQEALSVIPGARAAANTAAALGAAELTSKFIRTGAEKAAVAFQALMRPGSQKRLMWRMADEFAANGQTKWAAMATWAAANGGDRVAGAMFETLYGAGAGLAMGGIMQGMVTSGEWDAILSGAGGGALIGGGLGGTLGAVRKSDAGKSSAARSKRSIKEFEKGGLEDATNGSLPNGAYNNGNKKYTQQEAWSQLNPKEWADYQTLNSREARLAMLNKKSRQMQKEAFSRLPKHAQEFIATSWEALGWTPKMHIFENQQTYRTFMSHYMGRRLGPDFTPPAGFYDPASKMIFVDGSRPEMGSNYLTSVIIHELTHAREGAWLNDGDAVEQSAKVVEVLKSYQDPNGTPFELPNGESIRLSGEMVDFANNYDAAMDASGIQEGHIGMNALKLADETLSASAQLMYAQDPNVWNNMGKDNRHLLARMSNGMRDTLERLGMLDIHGRPKEPTDNISSALYKSKPVQRVIANYKLAEASLHRYESEAADRGYQITGTRNEVRERVRRIGGGNSMVPQETVDAIAAINPDFWPRGMKRIAESRPLKVGDFVNIKKGRGDLLPESVRVEATLDDGTVKLEGYTDPVPAKSLRRKTMRPDQVAGVGLGNEGSRLPKEVYDELLKGGPAGRQAAELLERVEGSILDGNVLKVFYSNRTSNLGNNEVVGREITPIQFSVSNKRNILLQGWDMGAVQYNLKKLQDGGFMSAQQVRDFHTNAAARFDEISERLQGIDPNNLTDIRELFKIRKGSDDELGITILAALGTPPENIRAIDPQLAQYMHDSKMKHVAQKGGTLKSFRIDSVISLGEKLKDGQPVKGLPATFLNVKEAYMPHANWTKPVNSPENLLPMDNPGMPGSYSLHLIQGPENKTAFHKQVTEENNTVISTPSGTPVPSRVHPPRVSLIDETGKTRGTWASVEDLHRQLNADLAKIRRFARENPEEAKNSLGFYSGMADAAARLSTQGDSAVFDVRQADLHLRQFAYLSVRSSVPSNTSKAGTAGIGPFLGQYEPGFSAGSQTQIRGMGKIFQDWEAGKALDMTQAGVANKVRNFYINGMTELLEKVLNQPAGTDPNKKQNLVYIAEKINNSLGKQGLKDGINSTQDVIKLQTKLARLQTVDMWDMSAKGQSFGGFVLAPNAKGQMFGYKWSNPDQGRTIEIFQRDERGAIVNDEAGNPVMTDLAGKILRWHNDNGDKGKYETRKPTSFDDLSYREKKNLVYDEQNQTIKVWDEGDDAGLAAGGESPLYERMQAYGGMLTDALNAEGGLMGQTELKALDLQQFMWGMEKFENPLPANRDFSSYDRIVNEAYQLLDKAKAEGVDWRTISDPELKAGASFLEATQRSYEALAEQTVPLEVITEQPGQWGSAMQTQLQRLTDEGDPNPKKTVTSMISEMSVPVVQKFIDDNKLDVIVDEVPVGIGGYTEKGETKANTAPSMVWKMRGNPEQVDQVMDGLAAAYAQADNMAIRNLTAAQRMANEEGTTFLQIQTDGMTEKQIVSMFEELNTLQDADGNPIFTGFTPTGDNMVIGGSYYAGGVDNFEKAVQSVLPQVEEISARHNKGSLVTLTEKKVKTYDAEQYPEFYKSGNPKPDDRASEKVRKVDGRATGSGQDLGRKLRSHVLRRLGDIQPGQRAAPATDPSARHFAGIVDAGKRAKKTAGAEAKVAQAKETLTQAQAAKDAAVEPVGGRKTWKGDVTKEQRSEIAGSLAAAKKALSAARKAEAPVKKGAISKDMLKLSQRLNADVLRGTISEDMGIYAWKIAQAFTVAQKDVRIHPNLNQKGLDGQAKAWIRDKLTTVKSGTLVVENLPENYKPPQGYGVATTKDGESMVFKNAEAKRLQKKGPAANQKLPLKEWWATQPSRGARLRVPQFDGTDVLTAVTMRKGKVQNIEILNETEAKRNMQRVLKAEEADAADAAFMPADQDYFKAVQSGDTATTQQMVDAAAKVKGFVKSRHATGANFTTFDRSKISDFDPDTNVKGFHFSNEADVTSSFRYQDSSKNKVMDVYLDLGRVIDRRTAQKMVSEGKHEDNFPVGFDTVVFRKSAGQPTKQQELDFDAGKKVSIPNTQYYVVKSQEDGGADLYYQDNPSEGVITGYLDLADAFSQHQEEHYVIKSPNQIKSAEPVTYDEAGNPIPLSQRFDVSQDDTRFMPADQKSLPASPAISNPRGVEPRIPSSNPYLHRKPVPLPTVPAAKLGDQEERLNSYLELLKN